MKYILTIEAKSLLPETAIGCVLHAAHRELLNQGVVAALELTRAPELTFTGIGVSGIGSPGASPFATAREAERMQREAVQAAARQRKADAEALRATNRFRDAAALTALRIEMESERSGAWDGRLLSEHAYAIADAMVHRRRKYAP